MTSIPRRSKIFDIGDIVRVPFPYAERDRYQARPALVIGRPVGPDGLLTWTLMITSAQRGPWPGDVPIGAEHTQYGLPLPCFVRVEKIAAVETVSIERRVGRLPDELIITIQNMLLDTLALSHHN
jgi:mRNA interferase MazF